MNPLILILDDSQFSLKLLRDLLERNNYDVISAINGREALQTLSGMKDLPDLIISDIMMPEMDGYEFFRQVSKNPNWNLIPFIFLSALRSEEQIRSAKMLGIDDYIVKPFNEHDVLAVVIGKLRRSKKFQTLNEKVDILFKNFKLKEGSKEIGNERNSSLLLFMKWDDKFGPELKSYYPMDGFDSRTIEQIGFQLFNGIVSIQGQAEVMESQGILLRIANLKKDSYIFFDALKDDSFRGRERVFMLGIIHPSINYFQSMQLKEKFQLIASVVKSEQPLDFKSYWDEINEIFSNPII